MLKKDDIVIYGSHGVCKIVEIGALDIGLSDKNQRYYTIRPVGRTDTVFYLPKNNSIANFLLFSRLIKIKLKIILHKM